MKPIFIPDPVRSATMRGPSDGESIGDTLVFVDRNSLDENKERNFCLNHFLGDFSLFGGVDIGNTICYRWDLKASMSIFAYIISRHNSTHVQPFSCTEFVYFFFLSPQLPFHCSHLDSAR